jgi:hypothetical protein
VRSRPSADVAPRDFEGTDASREERSATLRGYRVESSEPLGRSSHLPRADKHEEIAAVAVDHGHLGWHTAAVGHCFGPGCRRPGEWLRVPGPLRGKRNLLDSDLLRTSQARCGAVGSSQAAWRLVITLLTGRPSLSGTKSRSQDHHPRPANDHWSSTKCWSCDHCRVAARVIRLPEGQASLSRTSSPERSRNDN